MAVVRGSLKHTTPPVATKLPPGLVRFVSLQLGAIDAKNQVFWQ